MLHAVNKHAVDRRELITANYIVIALLCHFHFCYKLVVVVETVKRRNVWLQPLRRLPLKPVITLSDRKVEAHHSLPLPLLFLPSLAPLLAPSISFRPKHYLT